MTFRLAIAGALPADPAICRLFDEQIGQIRGFIGAAGQDVTLELLVSPSYTGPNWKEPIRLTGYPVCCYRREDTDWDELCHQVISMETPLDHVLGEEMCDKADLLLAVWNEDVTEMDSKTWSLLQQAHSRKVPAVWISSRTRQLYWSGEFYYEQYSPDLLKEVCGVFAEAPLEPAPIVDDKIPLLDLGIKLRRRYLKKHDADISVVAATTDRMLTEEFDMSREHPSGETVRKKLLESFRKFDESAITLNSKYQAVMYWRAVLPFVTTGFCALGFYAETILGGLPLPVPPFFWAMLACCGFMIHGLLNLYVYILSQKDSIKSWHRDFLDNRHIAEMLRVLIHFVPYGITLNLRNLCSGNPRLYMAIRHLSEDAGNGPREVNRKNIGHLLSHLEEMLEDQLAYHTFSAARYTRISDNLDRWSGRIVGVGFVVIVMRSILQGIRAVAPIEGGVLYNDISLDSYIGTLANMTALLLPAWGAYFTSKQIFCNYRYNAVNHQHMVQRLQRVLEQVQLMRNALDQVPIEAVNTLGEELAELMLVEDTSAWHRHFQGAVVKRL